MGYVHYGETLPVLWAYLNVYRWREDDRWVSKTSYIVGVAEQAQCGRSSLKHSARAENGVTLWFSTLQMVTPQLLASCPLSKSKNYYWFITQLSLYVCFWDLYHTRILKVHKLLPFSSECLEFWWACNTTNSWQSFENFHETFSLKHFIIYEKMCYLKKILHMWETLTAIFEHTEF